MQQNIWFTPEGLEDLLPQQAKKLEHYRRQLLDGFYLSGYELVLPPIAEFTDALLTGTGRHLAVDTCRFTDQESGKMMGVRADMTPQVARIVTNRLKSDEKIVRLCYVGEVLKTRNNKAKGSRSPIQIGAELFGYAAVEADIEVIDLMLESMKGIGIHSMTLSLGNVAIVDELMALAKLSQAQQSELIDILERKAVPEYETFVANLTLAPSLLSAFSQLLSFCGSAEDVFGPAQEVLASLSPKIAENLDRLLSVIAYFNNVSDIKIHLDLSDIRGYQYHNGIIFSGYVSGRQTYLLAKGGRYDGVGSEFGAAQLATGFSMDLRGALDLLSEVNSSFQEIVYAPMLADAGLFAKLNELKAQKIIVKRFYDQDLLPVNAQVLEFVAGEWSIISK